MARCIGQRAGLRATVNVDFRARSAGARLAHFPEIVLFGKTQDLLRIDVGLCPPPLVRFVVRRIHRRPEFLLGKFPDLGQQFPGPADGFLFVVIAKRPVPQHLEEGVVVGIAAHFFQIVMLTGDAQTFLGIDHPPMDRPLDPEKDIFERYHAGIGKQQRRIIGRNQRRTRDNLMAPVGKKLQEAVAYLVPCHGGYSFHWLVVGRLNE